MADKTDCRTTEVLRRAKKRRRLHENHLFAGLSSICITLICCLFCTQNKNKCFKTNKNDEEKTKWKKDS
ncbi:MAG: hypothetical protein RR263_04670 [Oscillospiraceae bacterium]